MITSLQSVRIYNYTDKNSAQQKPVPIAFTARTIAITGNIASGKSTVQKLFEKHGIPSIDVDIVTHNLYKCDKSVIRKVKAMFSKHGINSLENDDFIDRKKIRTVVFQNKEIKKDLEQIVHPAVNKKVEEFIEENKHHKNVAVFNPLLFETNGQSKYDYVMLIKIQKDEQLKRLLARNSFLTPETAMQRINSQLSQNIKENRADFVIDNSYGKEYTEAQVSKLMKTLNKDISPSNGLYTGISYLKSMFFNTAKSLDIPPDIAAKEFAKIISNYDVTQRGYHGIKHIETMLKGLEEYRMRRPNDIKNPEVLKLGIFMHDIVNGEKNDVQKSAEIAVEFLNQSRNPKIREKTPLLKDMILGTTYTESLSDKPLEVRLLADLDLSILASPKPKYNMYTKLVREEYKQYSDKEFAQGRIEIMKGFLDKKNIFNTDYYQKVYESKARENIKDEIEILKSL